MRRTYLWLCSTGLLAIILGCGDSTPDGKTPLPAGGGGQAGEVYRAPQWTAEPALLERLAAETTDPLVKKYRLCPPKGYRVIAVPPSKGGQGESFSECIWHDKEGNHAAVLLQIIQRSQPFEDKADVMAMNLASVLRRDLPNFSMQNVDLGQIGGIDFGRIRWTADGSKGKLHGILYAAVEGNRVVRLLAQDAETHDEDTLRVAEAAILTWKKAE